MSKEHKILTEFFTFLATKQDHLQLQAQDAEKNIQDYFNHRIELAEIAKEEKRQKQLKKLELIVKKREEQQKRAKIPMQQTKQVKIASDKRPKAKTIREMQALIDRIRN
ncbi:hypothetical protein L3049_02205 [Labilibaculum sp. DW002]|uniref:Uncharacterized protein n=1 Tax=Paralabilibaculum antarcticum TaxID=2912572 RepID=A0ABT5VR89_9BACT|nr:hypothetical protein [Labilibaculum sp. DW002]MDE5416804.1 hypothetical protein [Labilibaculum sp. DW002]